MTGARPGGGGGREEGDVLYVRLCSHAHPLPCSPPPITAPTTSFYPSQPHPLPCSRTHLPQAPPTSLLPHPTTTGPTHLSVPLDDGNPLADALRDFMVGHCPLDLWMRTIISVTPYQGHIEPPLAISIYCHGSPNYRRSGNFRS